MIPAGPWSFDLIFTRAVQAYQPAWLTLTAKTISAVSQPEIIVPTVIGLALWLLIRKQTVRDLALVFIMVGNLLTLIIKGFIQRPRPASPLVHVLVHGSATSFPSGHALAAVLTAGAIWLLFRTRRPAWFHLALIAYVVAVGWSRIYLGVHWLSDVVAGYVIGVLWLLLTVAVAPDAKKGS